MSETSDASDHEFRIACVQHFRRKAETLENAWAQVFYENISTVDKAQEDFSVFVCFEIKCDGALVAINESPPQTFTIFGIAPCHVAQTVATIGTFDLDDIGTEVAEIASTVGASENCRQVNDAKTRQCLLRGHELGRLRREM